MKRWAEVLSVRQDPMTEKSSFSLTYANSLYSLSGRVTLRAFRKFKIS